MKKDYGRLRRNRPSPVLFEIQHLKSLKATPDDQTSNKATVKRLSPERDRIFSKNPRGRAELETPRDQNFIPNKARSQD